MSDKRPAERTLCDVLRSRAEKKPCPARCDKGYVDSGDPDYPDGDPRAIMRCPNYCDEGFLHDPVSGAAADEIERLRRIEKNLHDEINRLHTEIEATNDDFNAHYKGSGMAK